MAKKKLLTVDTGFLETFYSVSAMSIGRWVKAGAPKLGKNLYDLVAFNEWYLLNIYESTGSCDDDVLKLARSEYWQSKARRETIKADKDQKAVMPVADVQKGWAHRLMTLIAGLNNLRYRLPPVLVNRSQSEMAPMIDDEIQTLIRALTDPETVFTPRIQVKGPKDAIV